MERDQGLGNGQWRRRAEAKAKEGQGLGNRSHLEADFPVAASWPRGLAFDLDSARWLGLDGKPPESRLLDFRGHEAASREARPLSRAPEDS